MKPVLFLDFDGPLFPERAIDISADISKYPGTKTFHPFITYWEMDQIAVKQLNTLYGMYQFDTVVSSSWRDFCDCDEIVELFQVNGLDLHLHNDWSTEGTYVNGGLGRRMGNRAREISDWLSQHEIDNIRPAHIILDDPWSGRTLDEADLKELGLHNLVMVDPNMGISKLEYRAMYDVVKSWVTDHTSRYY